MDELTFDGKVYISSKKAAKLTGYTTDYIGQLCRSGKLSSKMVGRNRYIEASALPQHKRSKGKEAVSVVSSEELKVRNNPTILPPQQQETHARRMRYAPRVGESARPRYRSHIVSNALSLSYERDERPLYPSLQKGVVSQTGAVASVTHKEPAVTQRVVSIRHKPYYPKNVRQPHTHSSANHTRYSQRNQNFSSRRDIELRQYEQGGRQNRHDRTVVVILLAMVLAVVSYASFMVTETLVYGKGLKGFELKMRAIDLF